MPSVDKAEWWQEVTEYIEILNPGGGNPNSGGSTIDVQVMLDMLRDDIAPFLSGYRGYLLSALGVTLPSTPKLDKLLLTGSEDFVVGQAGSDYIEGRGNDDILFGDTGADIFSGSQGNDFFVGHSEDDISGSRELVSYLSANSGVTVSLSDDVGFTSDDGRGGYDVLIHIDDIVGSDFDDDIESDNTNDSLLFGGLGNDSISAGTGNDVLDGGEGNDNLLGNNGSDIFIGSEGVDTIETGASSDRVIISQTSLDDATNNHVIIEDFTGGISGDVLDVSALLAKTGYRGNDPVAESLIYIEDAGADAHLIYDADGIGGNAGINIATLQNFDHNNFSYAHNLITEAPKILFAPILGQSNGKGMSSSGGDGVTGVDVMVAGLQNMTGYDEIVSIGRDDDTNQPLTMAVGGTTVDGNTGASSGYAPNRVWWYPDENEPGDILMRATDMLATQLSDLRARGVVKPIIVWSQGEAETRFIGLNPDPVAALARYKNAVLSVFDYMKDRLGDDLEFYIMQTGRFNDDAARNSGESETSIANAELGVSMVRQGQEELAVERGDIHIAVDYADLPMLYDTDPITYPNDVWHLDYDAREIIGQRLADYISADLNPRPDTPDAPAVSDVMIGTWGDDEISGSLGDNILHGLGGADTINGLGGTNVLFGGTGRDRVNAAPGHDRIVMEDDIYNITNNSDYIRNFETGIGGDQLDITHLLKAAGYYGDDPIGDGYLVLVQDGTRVTLRFDIDGAAGLAYNDVYMGKLADVDLANFSSDHNLVFDRNIDPPVNMVGTSGRDQITGSIWGGILEGLGDRDTLTADTGDTVLIGGEGIDNIRLGSGRDTVVFEADINSIANNSDYISYFETGVEGDRVDITNLLLAMGYYGDDPITDGYLELRQEGTDLSLFVDVDGSGPENVKYLGKLANVNENDFLPDINLVFSRNAVPPENIVGTSGDDILTIANGGGTIDGLEGDDRLTMTGGNVDVHGGEGRDVIMLGAGQEIVFLESDTLNITDNSDYIRNFTMGSGGDKLDLTALLNEVGYTGSNPLTDGYLQLLQDGANVALRFDVDGAAGSQNSKYMGKLAFVDAADFSVEHNLVFNGSGGAPASAMSTPVSGNNVYAPSSGGVIAAGVGHDNIFAGVGEDIILFEDDLNNIFANSDVIYDFQAGASGDVLDISDILDEAGYTGSDPIADGYLVLDQIGDDTELLFDVDGSAGAGAAELMAILVDTQASDISPDNINII